MDIKRSWGPVALAGVEPIESKVNEAWRIYEDALVPYSLRGRFGGGKFAASCVCEGNLIGEGEAGSCRKGIPEHT